MAPSVVMRGKMKQLTDLRRRFRAEFTGMAEAEAKQTAARIKQRIYSQGFGHAPLNPAYRRWKVRHGLDRRILIATGAYVASIGARKQNKETWLVSPAPGQTHNGRALSTIGLWLEYGTRHMLPRPHYRPEVARTRQRLQALANQKLRRIARTLVVR